MKLMQENKNMITTLIKIKELQIWEIERDLKNEKDDKIIKTYSSLLSTMKSELKILSNIVKFEDKIILQR